MKGRIIKRHFMAMSRKADSVYLKNLNLYGIIGTFSADEVFTTYYKSNQTFEQDESVLGHLHKDYLRSGKELRSIRRH